MCFLKVSSVVVDFKGQGNLFHKQSPQIEKTLLPRARGITKLLKYFDRNMLHGL